MLATMYLLEIREVRSGQLCSNLDLARSEKLHKSPDLEFDLLRPTGQGRVAEVSLGT